MRSMDRLVTVSVGLEIRQMMRMAAEADSSINWSEVAMEAFREKCESVFSWRKCVERAAKFDRAGRPTMFVEQKIQTR